MSESIEGGPNHKNLKRIGESMISIGIGVSKRKSIVAMMNVMGEILQ